MVTTTKKRQPAKPRAASKKKSTALTRQRPPVTLITGGTGFLGAHLLKKLIADGATNLRVLTTGAPAWLQSTGVEIIEGSITNPDDVKRAVEGVGEVYHLAGKVSRDDIDAREMYSIHVDGTRVLCQAAVESGVKSLLLVSTSGTIAVTEDSDLLPDEDWPQPVDIISRWPYYASKYYQERVALETFRGDGLRLVIVNPSLLLGPGDDRLSSTRVILDFLGRKITAVPTGGLNFVDVRDAADGLISGMQNGRNGERYLLGAANWSFENFFARLERLTKVKGPSLSLPSAIAIKGSKIVESFYKHWKMTPPVEAGAVEMAEYFWYFDHSKAERELGFTPRDPAETLNDTVSYIRKTFIAPSAFSAL
jgi:nucleoside-diphosphate-sugar epimerase